MSQPRPTPEQMKQFNQTIIAEFRANAGKVGGPFEGQPMVLLTTVGARSGKSHTTPLVSGLDGDTRFVVASFAGAPKHPAWYHNLLANPSVQVEAGEERYQATARPADEPKRSELYAAMENQMSAFTDYRQATDRTIPVVLLERA
ncbi:MAG: nitroreductase family deazaflavin-dependent oxidoreductase [Myxococcales bacterium]|nr:nitroreductase family deazaflavin-dependent oxidoreductase [Myxococcales bacterium]MDD9971825.1 nitroreductase family deazaflavin-dependent oxidoreductase [Myxococcales bacterium]